MFSISSTELAKIMALIAVVFLGTTAIGALLLFALLKLLSIAA